MGYLEAFDGNAKGTKHPIHIRRHTKSLRRFVEKNMDDPVEFRKWLKTTKIHAFRCFQMFTELENPEAMEYVLWACEFLL